MKDAVQEEHRPVPECKWSMVKLGDVCDIKRGSTITSKVARPGDVPVVAGGIKPAYFHDTPNRPANVITVSGSGANAGYVDFHDVPIWASDSSTVIPKDERLNVHFVYRYLLAAQQYIYDELARGAAQPHVYPRDLAKILVPLPPLEEQKRIVAVLDQAFAALDRARAHAEANLGDVSDLVQRSIDKAFETGAETLKKPLSEFIAIGHGFAFKSKDFASDDNPLRPIVLTPGNYHEDAVLYFRESKTKRLTVDPPEGFLFEEGELTVVMTDLSSKMKILGKPAFIDRKGILHNQRIGRMRFLSGELAPRYLFHFMRSTAYLSEIRATATGTMVRHTAPKRILACNIPTIDPESQDEVASRLDHIESRALAVRKAIQMKLAEIDSLRQSLLQKAFSGQLTG